MLGQQEAERGLVLSLLRWPEEEADEALERVASLPVAIEPEDIANEHLRTIFSVVLSNAANEVATSVRLAAQMSGVDEAKIADALASVDRGALRVYAEAVAYHSARRQLTSAAEAAVEIASNGADPSEALDSIAETFASISLASEEGRIATVAERAQQGEAALSARQQEMSNGHKRVELPLPSLNRMLPYLLPGQMVLVTGATKVGKSSFAGQLFDYNVKRGLPGLYFHFEDTPEVMDLRRLARQMSSMGNEGVPLHRLLSCLLNQRERELVDVVREWVTKWGHLGTEVYSAGWTMEQVIRVWRRLALRAKASGEPIRLVVIDYLNKAELPPQKLRSLGLYAARGRDAELVKQTAEATRVVAFLVQQEGDNGQPYETRQSAQKAQAWISLQRERLPNHSLDPIGKAVVKYANLGSTGAVQAEFLPDWMVWREL